MDHSQATEGCRRTFGSPHSSFSMMVSGMVSSSMVVRASTKGTPMITALQHHAFLRHVDLSRAVQLCIMLFADE